MPSAGTLLDEARRHIGFVEGPKPNETPYGVWSGFPFQAWCCSFTSYCLDKVGLSMGKIAYCPTAVNWYKARGQLFARPQVGDQMLLYYSGRYAHTGFVEVVDGDYVSTIEGNTDTAGGFSGGRCMRKRRLWRGTKHVFGRPAYTTDPVHVPNPAPAGTPLEAIPMAQVAPHPTGNGYIVLQGADGGVFTYEGAPFFGSLPSVNVRSEAVGLVWTKTGLGYWIIGKDGALFSFGDAQYPGAAFNVLPPEARGNRVAVGGFALGNGIRIIAQDPSSDGSPYDHYDFGV